MREPSPPNTAIRNRILKATRLIFLFLICLSFAACPPAAKKPPVKKPPKQGELREKPKEVTKPAGPSQVMTPQRKASDRLIDKGKTSLDTKSYDQAAQLFQDAANVDPSNGVAYYYLALTDHYLGEQHVAAGLLDKAESLLRSDGHWMGKIEELRTLITGEKPSATPLPPVIDQY